MWASLAIEFGKIDLLQDLILIKNELQSSSQALIIQRNVDLMILKHQKIFVTSSKKMIGDCEIYIITVPTPVDPSNRPNLELPYLPQKSLVRTQKNNIVIYELPFFREQLRKFVPI